MMFLATAPSNTTLSNGNPMPDLKDYMTTEEAAAKMTVNLEYLRQMIRKKKMPAVKIGRDWLVFKNDVETYVKKTKTLAKNDPRRSIKAK